MSNVLEAGFPSVFFGHYEVRVDCGSWNDWTLLILTESYVRGRARVVSDYPGKWKVVYNSGRIADWNPGNKPSDYMCYFVFSVETLHD